MSNLVISPSKLPGVLLIQPRCFPDTRGFFTEAYHVEKYMAAGMKQPFVQDNFSFSKKHVLRGLHYQLQRPQAKLVYVVQGEIFDVAVDIRRGSPTYGQWESFVLSGENHHQLFVPEGYAHGFLVLSETASVLYKCTNVYCPADDYGFRWNDPDLAITWPADTPLLSEKDAALPYLRELAPEHLPRF